uniref:Rab-like protein 2A n=1 Tax=Chlamydomonas leiostraca TaxID=1034604 RepID=A0A7S0S4Z4_9CHLO|mmetsp:Transcript_8412/g.20990  ORF Transcript_8412/g.20990 Transcript_8412/m.20990 type:complete len:240 (+) Transcript_8412:53-772(+)
MSAEERSGGAGTGPGSGPQGEELTLLTGSNAVKVILLGDSAVGKSKLVERFLLDNYKPHQLSTYALTLYRHDFECADNTVVPIDIWDTAGQERFNSMHASYYYRAHACIMVFDVTRKVTYKNLEKWYEELQSYCKGIPTIVVANKIDVDLSVTTKSFAFAAKNKLPFFFVSASDGTNVVKIFQTAIMSGIKYKASPKEDFYQEVLDLLGEISMDTRKELEAAVKAHEQEEERKASAGKS